MYHTISCHTCGKDFSVHHTRLKTAKYCSNACYAFGRIGRKATTFPRTEEKTFQMFWSNVIVAGQNECWIWTGPISSHGYGRITHNGKRTGAHRVSWIIANGPISEGLHILHRCDVPKCVNPNHLFIGTAHDNMVDKIMKVRQTNQKLTPHQALAIRNDRRKRQTIADEYGISINTVNSIRYRKAWKHLPD